MKIIDPGHLYELQLANGEVITLPFVKKEKSQNPDEKMLVLTQDGITNEDLIEVLIDRLKFLMSKLEDGHTKLAIFHLESALGQLNARTENRIRRGVEGTNQK